MCPREMVNELLSYAMESIKLVSVRPLSKIKIYARPDSQADQEIADILRQYSFKLEGELKKEIGNIDIEVYAYMFAS